METLAPDSTQTTEASSSSYIPPEDNLILCSNRQLKMQLIRSLTPNGKLPEDKADKIALLHLLDSVEGEIFTRAKIKIAAKTEETNSDLTALVAKALQQHRVASSMPKQGRTIDLPATYVVKDAVPGETDQGVRPVTMEDLGI